ncbi:MAG: DUF58 domain-containing protein [Saprospirales bacterium]|nr:MAG: DUF58 domain-containing protein [Saprospirales bacterium]
MAKKDPKELLREVRKLEIRARRISEQHFSGDYRSAFRGSGLSFSEVRPYQYGDEVRNIDWNVTARTGEAHVKIFEEERESSVLLIVDNTASMFFGGKNSSKREKAIELAATIAYSAFASNDRIGLFLFDASGHQLVPPGKGKTRLFKILKTLIENDRILKGSTDLQTSVSELVSMNIRSNICFFISDFQSENYHRLIKLLSLKYDLTGLYIEDAFEREAQVPFFLNAIDVESDNSYTLPFFSSMARNKWRTAAEERWKRNRDLFRSAGAEVLYIDTAKSFVPILLNYFKMRGK